ncbi:hypothetical protein TEA_022572 [Camellia sinensis var. sinensis]|uniref:Metal-nicotianamine transporter YSL7 n=1 Tax=Camellia sinensis var. sinensis TaxID=542762 RepID=A0A4S4EIG3_CAMSN|nr:hypothetical protein TEA_022572 [Camellia sinensis var. sinensis]
MSEKIAKQSTEADDARNIKNPAVGWMIGFLFIVSFLGLFSVVPLRKIMILDFKLIYPSGTATAHLINSFHTPQGAKLAKKQVRALGKFFSFSFLWGFFQWFYTAGHNCGFSSFPTFGLKAFENRFYFDFSATYVGVGMICPHLINVSLLLGAILSWGIMWPLIYNQRGHWWQPADLSQSSLRGLQGYRIFIGIAMILGDGLYNFIKVLGITLWLGTATAHLINSFHTPQGAQLAKKQVRALGKFFSFSFLWGFFQWFYTAGHNCGFSSFPTFGLKAFENRFYFDFSATYVGVGMICPHLINVSVLLGAILSWGIMWPLIYNQRGHWWQPADLSQSSLRGLQGYRIFIGIAMILGDGLYNFIKVLGITLFGLYRQFCVKDQGSVLPVAGGVTPPKKPTVSYDDQRRTQLFLKDEIPECFAVVGYVGIAIISTAVLPHIFHQLKWYYIVVIYVFAPALAFCNAYGCGLTDWSLASTYGKLAIFTIGAWAGASHGGVLAGLAACGVMMNIVSTASDLMQDFKTGYMTLASPRSMFVSQVIGTAMGCVISPCVFWLFYKAFHDLGIPGTQYPAPNALVFRNMAILGVEGFSALPKNCLTLCYVFFIIAVAINAIRDAAGKQRAKFIPIPMAMAIPFYIGSYFAIDMCVGSLILFVWQKINKKKADAFGPAVASGLICGDGIWTLPSSILALAGVNPPICMKFLSRTANAKG